jgi:asparaginyl-tRNA synthetase
MASIKRIFSEKLLGETTVKGWVRSIRKKKKFSFVVINDGSCQENLQIVLDLGLPGYDDVSNSLTGASVEITGEVVESQGRGQNLEMIGKQCVLLGECDESYPLQKKATSLEFIREHAHLRSRTNLFGAVFRIRNELAKATHDFFYQSGFYYVNTPIITAIDAEGAGEMFNVSTLDPKNLPLNDKKEIDYSKDYFGKSASLTVSGQLNAECLAMGLGKVYTFGPTFRSEKSFTSRHLSEFWMVEPEAAFMDLDDIADLGRDYIKYLIERALKNCQSELKFLEGREEVEENLLDRLQNVLNNDFVKITYTEAVGILLECGEKFEYRVEWGAELQTEHERYLTESHFKSPVIVTDYPKACKAFYMKQNSDNKTVRAMDILVPGVGEIIGGSQREEDLLKLKTRMKELDMDEQQLDWYLDLRKYGSVVHSGFGLGFERAVMYITGMKNIRDVIPFPRATGSAEF